MVTWDLLFINYLHIRAVSLLGSLFPGITSALHTCNGKVSWGFLQMKSVISLQKHPGMHAVCLNYLMLPTALCWLPQYCLDNCWVGATHPMLGGSGSACIATAHFD